jgi:cation:H+ antiporter
MGIELSLILFFVGFYVLIKGAKTLVDGAVSVARIFNISNWFIGVVIVGIGTSIPELSINLASVFNGGTIGLGTIIGSNTFNILFILGISALFYPILMKKEWVLRDFLLNILSVVITAIFIIFPIFGDNNFLGVTRGEALFLFLLFIGWILYMFYRKHSDEDGSEYKIFTVFISFVMVLAGIIGVFIGGRWVVGGAETIAKLFGASESLIGLTIVAVGTSLPELTVSIAALIKRRTGIAVGNIVGSNIFDFLGIVGITALLHPIATFPSVRFDIFAALGAALLLFALTFIGRKYILSRAEGFLFIACYTAYLVFIIWRG